MKLPLIISSFLVVVFLFAVPKKPEDGVKVAVFDFDVTPPVGSAMAYTTVEKTPELSLRCRGVVILGSGDPIVLCAIDWIGVANEGYDAFRDSLAEAAGTTRERVTLHALHQHDAPGCDFTAEKLVKELGLKGYERLKGGFHRDVVRRTFSISKPIESTVTGNFSVARHAFAIPSAKRRANLIRFSLLPSLYFPAPKSPPAPLKCT